MSHTVTVTKATALFVISAIDHIFTLLLFAIWANNINTCNTYGLYFD